MKRFAIFGRPPVIGGRPISLLTDAGRVRCPNDGDIEVDVCARCPRLVAIDGARVRCRDERPWWRSDTYLSI
jgi:hypothetical protein